MQQGLTMHTCVALDYLEEYVRVSARKHLETGLGITLGDIAEHRSKGHIYWPNCESIRPDGHCAGHTPAGREARP